MFLAKKSPRSYVGLYRKFLYKIFTLLMTPPPPNILLTPPPMRLWLRLVQGAQYSVLLNKLRPSTVISVNFPNTLLEQRLGWTVRDAPPSILPCEQTAMALLRGFRLSSRTPPTLRWWPMCAVAPPCIPLSSGSPQRPCWGRSSISVPRACQSGPGVGHG